MEELFKWTDLLEKYLQGTITPAEWEALQRQMESSATKQAQFDALNNPDHFRIDLNALQAQETAAAWQRFILVHPEYDHHPKKPVELNMYWMNVIKWTMTAAVFIGFFLYVSYKRSLTGKKKDVAVAQQPADKVPERTLPDTIPHVYFTSAGKRMNLMESRERMVIWEGGREAKKLGHFLDLRHKHAKKTREQAGINTIQTCAGQVFSARLEDGTMVWLGATSSLSFPAAFTGTQRVVELKGEAYFEVTSNAKMPFIVRMANGVSVEVIGTRLNVNARVNHPQEVTLLEGKAAVHRKEEKVTLQPGQQAVVDGQSTRVIPVNAQDAINYLKFDFSGWDIRHVLLYLSTWYGKPMVLQGRFSGALSSGMFYRNEKLDDILVILKRFNEFDYTSKEDTLVITGHAKN